MLSVQCVDATSNIWRRGESQEQGIVRPNLYCFTRVNTCVVGFRELREKVVIKGG